MKSCRKQCIEQMHVFPHISNLEKLVLAPGRQGFVYLIHEPLARDINKRDVMTD